MSDDALAPKILSFVLDGAPVPKGRHQTGKGHAYTPEKTTAAEERMALLIRSKRIVFDGPVQLLIEYRVKRWHGDWDNVAKLVGDALQKGGAVRNDRQIKRATVEEILADAESTTVWASDYVQRVE